MRRPAVSFTTAMKKVAPILQDVQENGDAALKKYTALFDGARLENLSVSQQEFSAAPKLVSGGLESALHIAKNNIEAFHAPQLEKVRKIETMPGVECWRKSVPVEKVGLYIPGGSAPLFSTLLMLGVPAKIAGCEKIVVCTPPDESGKIHPAVLFAAQLLDIHSVYKTGGAQAIAAMAYGTESIPQVDKIFGPGNQFVTAAKMLVQQEGVAIDLPAGPSELAIVADHAANPAFVAADLISQAEHGEDSQVMLVSLDEQVAQNVLIELEKQLTDLPRKRIAEQALANSKIILLQNAEEAIDFINAYAPEHLILAANDVNWFAERVENAGSVFLGNYAPESAGDYASGTNHALPTSGFARSFSGVSIDSFVKKITFQQLTPLGVKNLGGTVEALAEAEGLIGHKRAMTVRLESLEE